MTQRTSIFATPQPSPPLDVSDFQPSPRPSARPQPGEIDAANPASRFQSREPAPPAAPPTRRQPMTYRTGRNATFSAKTTPQTIAQFYAIAERQGWKAGETFEKAVAALSRETEGGAR